MLQRNERAKRKQYVSITLPRPVAVCPAFDELQGSAKLRDDALERVAFQSVLAPREQLMNPYPKRCRHPCRWNIVYLSNSHMVSVDEVTDARPDLETLAGMLVRGGFPENYDEIIRDMSDDDFERLWELFNQKRHVSDSF